MLRSWKTALVFTALSAAVLGGAAPDADAAKDLIVKRFLIGRLEPNTDKFIALGGRGTQNAFRDSVIMLVFSTQIDLTRVAPVNNLATIVDASGNVVPNPDYNPNPEFVHLNDRTIQIGIPAGPGLFIQAEGSFNEYVVRQFNPVSGKYDPKRTYRNRIIFDPTKRLDAPAFRNPYGLELNSLYSVTVPGLNTGDTKTVRGAEGQFVAQTFTTTFRTTDKYLQDYLQPRIVNITANDAPGVPLEGRTTVDSRADIIAEFSEPMLPAAFDPNTTFTVFISSPGTGRLVSGVIRPSPDGRFFTFRPAFGYGQGPSTVRVTLSPSLSDRSGNTLDRGAVVNFTSEYDPAAPQYNEIIETFDDPTDADWTFQNTVDRASWNGWIGPPPPPTSNNANNTNKNQGLLAAIFGAKTLQITHTLSLGDGIPFYYQPSQAQQLFSNAQIGTTARTISGFGWQVYNVAYQNAANNATFPGTTVKMGHNTTGSLSTTLSASFSDTPVTTVNNVSYKPVNTDGLWYNGPTYTTTWPYNGKDNLVIDIANQGSGSTSLIPYWGGTTAAPQGGLSRIRVIGGTPSSSTWSVDFRFFYLIDKSEAQSRWYDTTVTSPAWLDPIVTQSIPPGTVITITYQGASENPLFPGTPDPSAITPWTTDPLNDLGGLRFIRFHVDMTSNIGSNTRPTIDEIKLPHIFF